MAEWTPCEEEGEEKENMSLQASQKVQTKMFYRTVETRSMFFVPLKATAGWGYYLWGCFQKKGPKSN